MSREGDEKKKVFYCPKCGKEISVTTIFCPFCRKSLKKKIDEKEKVSYFFDGFLITYGVLLILEIIPIILFGVINIRIKSDIERIGYFSSLGALGFITIVIAVKTRNKNPYISMGMIAGIFGLAFLLIKTNGEQLVDP